MYPLITLLIASSIGISLFALITYKMRAKSQLRLRKSIILIGMTTSIITPILGLLLPQISEMLTPNIGTFSREALSLALEPIIIMPQGVEVREPFRLPSPVELTTALWILGFALASTSLAMHLLSLRTVLRGAELIDSYEGIKVYRLRKDSAPEAFSVFGKIYLPYQMPTAREREHILRHEAAHIEDGHGLERFLMLFFTRLYWFHPLAYYMQAELSDTHEYIADRLTISEQGFDVKAYQYHLLHSLLEGNRLCIVQSFNSDAQQLKKRILMMNRQQSTSSYRWVWLLALPIIATMLWATKSLSAGISQEEGKSITQRPKELKALLSRSNTTNPKQAEQELQKEQPASITESSGKIHPESHSKIGMTICVEAETPSLNEVHKEAIKQTPKALKKNKALDYEVLKLDLAYMDMAEFPGGIDSLMRYLSQNIEYPVKALKKKQQGRTIVQFEIDQEGKHSNYRIVRSASSILDAEALRVVRAMPDWKPAYDTKQQKNLAMTYTLPIVFRIQ